MPASTAKLTSIQSARAIAALLVVLHHMSLRFEQRIEGTRFLEVFDHFGFAGVDLFFVISGLIMMVTCQQHFGGGVGAASFLYRRATRIYPLYWLFTLAQVAAILLIASATERTVTTGNLISSLLLLPQAGYPILAPGWTLVYEMFFYLVFALLFFIPKTFCWHFLSAWGLLTIALYLSLTTTGMTDTNDLVTLPVYASPMNLEFIAGCWIGHLHHRKAARFGKSSLAIGALLFASGWYLVERFTDLSAEFGMTRVLAFGFSSALVLYGWVTLERRTIERGTSDDANVDRSTKRLIANRWLVAIGDASYSLYLSHLLVINAFVLIWSRLGITSPMMQLFYECMLLGVCIGVSLFTYRWIERPLLAYCRSNADQWSKCQPEIRQS
jgi:exopolysaccharide production protein ExoZ